MIPQQQLPQAKPYLAFNLIRSMHAVLYRVYSMADRGFVHVGTHHGTYGPEDASGAEYRCLGQPAGGKLVSHSRDWKTGDFYPENVFITGRHQDEDRPLRHDELMRFALHTRLGAERSLRHVLLPSGCGRDGHPTFEPALMFATADAAPYWGCAGDMVERSLKAKFPRAHIQNLGNWISLHGQDLVEDGAGA